MKMSKLYKKLLLDDNFRENYFKSTNWKKKVQVIILDDNPLSIAMYMEEHLEVSFDDDNLGPEDMIKLRKMLEDERAKNMTADDFVSEAGGKR